jgi:NADPH-dependent 2,4-dienoyl-CoA reductase/sulfur reductase-like enzyme
VSSNNTKTASRKKRILIVGGVAGGANAATRLRRLDETAEVVVFERGPHVSFANCGLPYHIGGEIKERAKLLQHTPETLRARFAIDVRIGNRVDRIDRASKEVEVTDLSNQRTYRESYDFLILSPGAAPLRPPVAGLEFSRYVTCLTWIALLPGYAIASLDQPRWWVVAL